MYWDHDSKENFSTGEVKKWEIWNLKRVSAEARFQ